jgi:hypothetical protein
MKRLIISLFLLSIISSCQINDKVFLVLKSDNYGKHSFYYYNEKHTESIRIKNGDTIIQLDYCNKKIPTFWITKYFKYGTSLQQNYCAITDSTTGCMYNNTLVSEHADRQNIVPISGREKLLMHLAIEYYLKDDCEPNKSQYHSIIENMIGYIKTYP